MDEKTPHTQPALIIYGFLILGIISAIAFRAITVLQHLEPAWVRLVWYIGVLGYMLFFLYRFYISNKRKKTIERFQLIEKIKANECLTQEDRKVVLYLLSSIKKSPENLNYLIIFYLSIIAIIIDLYIFYST